MKNTELRYMSNMELFECASRIVEVKTQSEKSILALDKTIFYPQGGGQSYDTGHIISETGTMTVEEVRFENGIVNHVGVIEGEIVQGQRVKCVVDQERRKLHSRIHSAGHVVDMTVQSFGLDWKPGKGFHFPEGPYVEYAGSFDEENEAMKEKLENAANEGVQDVETRIAFMSKNEMKAVCKNVPDYLPDDKPARVVFYGDFAVPCGGTHVSNLKDIGKISIRKIKQKKGKIKVSYSVT